MKPIEALVDQYCQGWSNPDPQLRARLIREALAAEATYTDPRANALSVAQLLEHISSVLSARPGATVERTSGVDFHHNLARFNWRALLPDGSTLLEGIDFIELEPGAKRIRRIVGFFGPIQARANHQGARAAP